MNTDMESFPKIVKIMCTNCDAFVKYESEDLVKMFKFKGTVECRSCLINRWMYTQYS